MATSKKVVSISARKINTEYQLARSSIVDSANHILNVGRLLTEAKERLGHGHFIPWIEAECNFSRQSAHKMMKAANVTPARHLTETDALQISRSTWGHTKDVIALKHTGDHESYTPLEYIEASREVMGNIDLDPASNSFAQQTVKADTYYTADDDGLDKDWEGCVFLNPPYEHPLIENFIDKLISEYEAGTVKQAILLTNNSADTQWFHKAAKVAGLVCLTEGRINFMKQDGTTSSPTNGQAFFYFGKHTRRFIDTYKQHGLVVKVCD